MSLPRTPARLEARTDTETPLGGREGGWTLVATLWIDLTPAAPRDLSTPDAPPLRLETATALARDDVRAARGQRLSVGAAPPWAVLAVDHARPSPGRMTLRLERTA